MLLFWFRPLPENREINFNVLLDDHVIFNNTYTGANDQYGWSNVSILLEPIFETYGLNIGVHRIAFNNSGSFMHNSMILTSFAFLSKIIDPVAASTILMALMFSLSSVFI